MNSLKSLFSAGLFVGIAIAASAAPSIVSIQPETGSRHGANTFNIQATGVEAGFRVYFGGIKVEAYKYGDIVSGYTPAHDLGEVSVKIVNPDTSSDTVAFEYVPFTVTAVESLELPASPVVTGRVAIYGTGLSDTYTNVYFDGLPASREGVVSSTRLVFVPPTGLSGVVDVTVEDHDGSVINFPDAYEWVPPVDQPEPSAFVPGEGDVAGGEVISITIDGKHLSHDSILFGDTPAEFQQKFMTQQVGSEFPWGNYEYRYTELSITVPPGAPGYVDVTFVAGERVSTFENGWSYLEQPANHDMAEAITIDADDVIEGSNLDVLASGAAFGVGDCPVSDRSLFYLVNSLSAGTLSVGLCAEQMYGTVQVFTPDFAQNYCADLDGCPTESSDTTLLTLPVEPCANYYIRVASAGIGKEVQGGDFRLTTSFVPQEGGEPVEVSYDDPDDAAALPDDGIVRFYTHCGTRTALPTPPTYPGVDFWGRIEAAQAGPLEFTIEGVESYSAWGVHAEDLEEIDAGLSVGNGAVQTVSLPGPGVYYLRIVKELYYESPVFLQASYPTVLPEGEGIVEGEPPVDGEGTQEGVVEGEVLPEGEGTVEGVVEGEGDFEGVIEGEETESNFHSGDTNADTVIELDELLRIIQMRNAGALHCDSTTEDGYAPGIGDQGCLPHSADYAPADWALSLTETLRMIQLYNAGGYSNCPSSEDGFCI